MKPRKKYMDYNRLTIETAEKILTDNMENLNLRRHCYAVGKTLRAFHDYYTSQNIQKGALSADEWEIVGILHDADWEKTQANPNQHTVMLMDWLKGYEMPEEMINVWKSHNNNHTHLREVQTLLEWTLECCDELTGFIVACALVTPEKSLALVTKERVLKKFKQKEFARAVDRDQILQCEQKTGINIDRFVEITLAAMQRNGDKLVI